MSCAAGAAPRSFVIAGAGRAGAHAAATLREQGFDGRIVMVGEEALPPYDRPPLSKQVLLGSADPAAAMLQSPGFPAAPGIELRTGEAAVAIDRSRRRLRLASGHELDYDRLLIATGARARRLALDADSASRVHYLRTADDALVLRDCLCERPRLVLVGGGVIGLEIAAAAVALGCAVTVVEGASRLMTRVLPPALSAALAEAHAAHGVRILSGRQPVRIEGSGARAHAVVLDDGQLLPADLVVAGIGATPETTLAESAGLEVADGIVTDASGRSSDPHIFAAGDVARSHHPVLDRPLRVESWQHAGVQGSVAARAMLGQDARCTDLPWMWSDQFDLHLQATGVMDDGDSLVVRDDWAAGSLFAFALRAGRLRGATGLMRDEAPGRDIRIAQLLITQGTPLDPAALADPRVRLKGLLRA